MFLTLSIHEKIIWNLFFLFKVLILGEFEENNKIKCKTTQTHTHTHATDLVCCCDVFCTLPESDYMRSCHLAAVFRVDF